MVTGQLEQAFKLAEKHMLEVQTILDLKRIIIAKEVKSSPRMEEKIIQSMIQLLENNKTIYRRHNNWKKQLRNTTIKTHLTKGAAQALVI